MKIQPILTLAGALLLLPVAASAQVVVDFDIGDNAGSGNVLIAGITNYSLSSTMVTPSSFTDNSWTAPASNGTIYGGVYRSSFPLSLQTGAAPDPDHIRIGAGSQTAYDAALVWNKADFLNNGASNPVNITSSSSFSAELGVPNTASVGRPDLRWLIVKDGTTYLSGVVQTGFTSPGSVYGSGDLTSLTWSIFTPSTDAATDQTIGTIGPPLGDPSSIFSDIDAVGFHVTSANATDGTAFGTEFSAFSANVAVIPEPSSFALLAGALGLYCATLRRRRAGQLNRRSA